jgi:hypothetical protein
MTTSTHKDPQERKHIEGVDNTAPLENSTEHLNCTHESDDEKQTSKRVRVTQLLIQRKIQN